MLESCSVRLLASCHICTVLEDCARGVLVCLACLYDGYILRALALSMLLASAIFLEIGFLSCCCEVVVPDLEASYWSHIVRSFCDIFILLLGHPREFHCMAFSDYVRCTESAIVFEGPDCLSLIIVE